MCYLQVGQQLFLLLGLGDLAAVNRLLVFLFRLLLPIKQASAVAN